MEVSKFWSKTKIIILVVALVIIGSIVGLIFLRRAKLKKEYIKLESQFTNSAPNYLLLEQIELAEDEYRKINIKAITKDKIVVNKRADDCDGYVIAESTKDSITYRSYLKCKNIYQTPGYGTTVTAKKQNKKKTQSEEDTTKPVITLYGSATETINVGDKYKDKGASATDNIDGDISKKIKASGKVDTSQPGTYKIKYTVSDKAGNTASKSRKVIVKEGAKNQKEDSNKDTVSPIITFKVQSAYQRICIGDKVDISVDGVYGYTASDDVDGDLTSKVKISGDTGNISSVGEYTITYKVSDKSGNEATSSRKFSVVDCNASSTVSTPSTPEPAPSTPSTPSTPAVQPDTSTSSSSSSTPVTPNINTNVQTDPTGVSAADNITVGVGATVSLNASVIPSNATNKSLTYRSINQAIATVDVNGIVKGVSPGQTRVIITTSNGKSKGVFVTVE